VDRKVFISQFILVTLLSFLYPNVGLRVFIVLLPSLYFITRKDKSDNHIEIDQFNIKSIEASVHLADQTYPYFRSGLNPENAMMIVSIVQSITDAPAVAITDKNNILAFIGAGCEKHPVGYPIRTEATNEAIRSGHVKIIDNKKAFNCKEKDCICPLESAVIVPLTNKQEVIGALKFYNTEKGGVSKDLVKIAVGIGKLLSQQIELADLDRQSQLLTEAKLDALQAQINPHFLFNALNAVNMYINKDPDYARKLVVKLSKLLRYMLGNFGRFISIEEEISYIEDYTLLENARFQDRITLSFKVDPPLLSQKIPVFTIQPLVQNAITHGILPKNKSGEIQVCIRQFESYMLISVQDDGVGISEDDLPKVFNPGFGKGCGVGIPNVNERLKILYNEPLEIHSTEFVGTIVNFKIPLNDHLENDLPVVNEKEPLI